MLRFNFQFHSCGASSSERQLAGVRAPLHLPCFLYCLLQPRKAGWNGLFSKGLRGSRLCHQADAPTNQQLCFPKHMRARARTHTQKHFGFCPMCPLQFRVWPKPGNLETSTSRSGLCTPIVELHSTCIKSRLLSHHTAPFLSIIAQAVSALRQRVEHVGTVVGFE